MAVFSRRVVQRMLNEASMLAADTRKRYVQVLNSGKPDSLAAEWELAILWAFGKIFSIHHEPHGTTRKKVDLVINDTDVRIAADIRTISDKGFEDENPVERLESGLRKEALRHKLRISKFSVKIKQRPNSPRKVTLAVPPRS